MGVGAEERDMLLVLYIISIAKVKDTRGIVSPGH